MMKMVLMITTAIKSKTGDRAFTAMIICSFRSFDFMVFPLPTRLLRRGVRSVV